MLLRRASFFLFGLSLSIIASTYLANGQVCPSFPINELGSTSELSPDGLVALAIRPASEESDPAESPINVRIVEYNFVCDTSGMTRNTSRYISVLVKLQCTTTIRDTTLDMCDGETEITRQAQFRCVLQNEQSMWSATTDAGTSDFLQDLAPIATFTTPIDTRCRRCIDERSRTVGSADPITHCEPCQRNCTEGQRRCFFAEGDVEMCCNFYDQGKCVESCPGSMVGGEDFECVCPLLSVDVDTGFVSYDRQTRDIGSIATYVCNFGYRVVGNVTLTCVRGGWDGQDSICERIVCDDLTIRNGNVDIEPIGRGLNSKATYRCNTGYGLKGNPTRMCEEDSSWSGSDPECANCSLHLFANCEECGFNKDFKDLEPVCVRCKTGYVVVNGKCELEEATNDASTSQCDTICIVGIVLAIVGAIILSVVVALVVFGVYHFMSNPATKLAKAGTEGLNGVARDNPLYLPPEEIIGDVETA